MDAVRWASDQGLDLPKKPMEDLSYGSNISTTNTNNNIINNNKRNITTEVSISKPPLPPRPTIVVERKTRPPKEQTLNCPRCNSINTKFCYYNNYSTTQPRYFCKTCRRYWTHGGSLRNVPVGGGSRKNKRSASFSSKRNINSSSSSNATISNIQMPEFSFLMGYDPTASTIDGVCNPNGFSAIIDHHDMRPSPSSLSFPVPDPSLCEMQLGFQENHESGRIFFPFEDLRQVSSTAGGDTNGGQGFERQGEDHLLGFWGGIIGGGNGASW